MGRRENLVERYLKDRVAEEGLGLSRKYVSPGYKGVADQLLFLPEGRLIIPECKCQDGKETDAQKRERMLMLELGFEALLVSSKFEVDCMIIAIKEGLPLC